MSELYDPLWDKVASAAEREARLDRIGNRCWSCAIRSGMNSAKMKAPPDDERITSQRLFW